MRNIKFHPGISGMCDTRFGAGIRPFRAHRGMPRTVAQVFYDGK